MRRRWTVVLEGFHSGTETELTFMRAWRRSTAERWAKMVTVDDDVVVKVVRRPNASRGSDAARRIR